MGRLLFGLMGLCVCFLINTTMKVGCAEASGTLEQYLLATDHCYAPIHTTSIIQCLMYLENDLNELAELWLKRQKKSIKCAYLAKGFSNELYICNYASVSQRALFVTLEFGRVWICGACLQLEQTASQLDEFWPINALILFFFSLRRWTHTINTKSTCYSITVHC